MCGRTGPRSDSSPLARTNIFWLNDTTIREFGSWNGPMSPRALGTPPVGCPNQIGHIGPFQLPNSRIVVDFAQRVYIRASGDESDLGPVRPHIEVAPVAGRDAALERAIVEIRRMQAERKK